MESTLVIGIILIIGFILGQLAAKLRLPKITGYILAGIILKPDLTHIIPRNFVDHTDFITNVSLCFITFSVGGTLLGSHIKKLGKTLVSITIWEAESAFLLVAAGFALLSPYLMNIHTATWATTFIPASLLLASLASPTDPSATLAVIHEYKAKGTVTSTIMGVAAFDDVMGIINYSIAIIISSSLILHQSFNINSLFLRPLTVIGGAILLGLIFGFILNKTSKTLNPDEDGALIIIILSLLCLCFGAATILGVEQLLATMVMGIVVVNFNNKKDKIFEILQKYTYELIFVLFFTLSGMHLNINILVKSFTLVLVFIILRTIGKLVGARIGASLAKADPLVKKYTGFGLIPQGGIVIGLGLMMKQYPEFNILSDFIINIIIGATVIHELAGPLLAKLTLQKAGEI